MSVKMKSIVTMRMSGISQSHSKMITKTRDLYNVIDEPISRDGTNEGFTPTETVLSSLLGCTNVVSYRIAGEMGIVFHAMNIDIVCHLDRRGAALEIEVDIPFVEIDMDIYVKTDASIEQINQIRSKLSKFCPIAVMLRASGTVINEKWHII